MQTRRTALVVRVPEVEPAVGALRLAFDPVARLGVPAHLTVLYPFVPAAGVDDDVLSTVACALEPEPAFAFALHRTDWFGDEVLWLAPDEPARFRALTERVRREFPSTRRTAGGSTRSSRTSRSATAHPSRRCGTPRSSCAPACRSRVSRAP